MSKETDLKVIMEKYASSQGYKLNPDDKIVSAILKGLIRNKEEKGFRYCPCRPLSGDVNEDSKIVCPCIYHKDEIAKDGHCHCNLFVRGD